MRKRTTSPARDRSSERGPALSAVVNVKITKLKQLTLLQSTAPRPYRNGPTRMGTEIRHGNSLILPGAVRFLKRMHQTALEVTYLKKLAISSLIPSLQLVVQAPPPFPTRAIQ